MFSIVPAAIIFGMAVTAVGGENGLAARHGLQSQLRDASEDLTSIQRENQLLLRELKLMSEDPYVIERMVAEELSWGRPGTVIYRFDGDQIVSRTLASGKLSHIP